VLVDIGKTPSTEAVETISDSEFITNLFSELVSPLLKEATRSRDIVDQAVIDKAGEKVM
jgi:hypothetical protein